MTMRLINDVTIGTQVGTIEYEKGSVRIHLTDLRGVLLLSELESLLREARDLDRRVNPKPLVHRRKR